MASRDKRDRARGAGRPPGTGTRTEAKHLEALYGHIYAVVRTIARGRVATYGQVAELAGIPGGARVAGAAMRFASDLGLPWQRVVGKRSATTAQVNIHDPVGAGIQRALLEAEGVEFSASGGISLARFGWLPLQQQPATAHPQRRTRSSSRPEAAATGRSRR
jgi:methylated-DNA-protein-cysteine methyltransferase-like protein